MNKESNPGKITKKCPVCRKGEIREGTRPGFGQTTEKKCSNPLCPSHKKETSGIGFGAG